MTNDRPDIAELAAELVALKRRVRRYGRALVATVALGASAAVLFATAPLQSQATRLTAQEITIVDSTGKTRGTWSGDSGIALTDSALALFNGANERRLLVNVVDDEPTIYFLDKANKTRMYMDVNAAGASRFSMSDDQGKQRLFITVDNLRNPALILNDEDGKRRYLAVVEKGEPIQALYDAAGNFRMYTNGGAFPRTIMYDGNGKQRAILGVNTDGDPLLGLNDAAEKQRFLVNIDQNEPTQRYLDANGNYRMYVNGGAVPRVVMYDAQGKQRNEVAVDNNGLPSISLSDTAERRRLLINVDNDAARLVFKNADGTDLAQLPAPAPAPGRAAPPAPTAPARR